MKKKKKRRNSSRVHCDLSSSRCLCPNFCSSLPVFFSLSFYFSKIFLFRHYFYPLSFIFLAFFFYPLAREFPMLYRHWEWILPLHSTLKRYHPRTWIFLRHSRELQLRNNALIVEYEGMKTKNCRGEPRISAKQCTKMKNKIKVNTDMRTFRGFQDFPKLPAHVISIIHRFDLK